NEYCVRVVYGGELDSTYFAMSCPVCETVTIGDVPCDPVTNTNGYYLNYNQQEGLVVEWDDPEGATQIKLYADGDYLGAVTATGAHHAIFISFDGPAPAGTYTIGLVAVHPDCESEMVEVPIYYDEVGDNDIVNAIYPNPTSDNVTIEAQGMKHITVANALGQVVYDADVEGDMIQLSLGQFKSGLYMVRVNTENGVSVKRVTVVK
ncbi:MAG: T9SS type A sorting domain-containing protein, partial [Bacteroidales bacterium]|nr:T9SS type A sorting domain-containing protein [Bacteroidales bacterium]